MGKGDGRVVAPLRVQPPCRPAWGLSMVGGGAGSARPDRKRQRTQMDKPPFMFWKVLQLLLGRGELGFPEARPLECGPQAEVVCGFWAISWPEGAGEGPRPGRPKPQRASPAFSVALDWHRSVSEDSAVPSSHSQAQSPQEPMRSLGQWLFLKGQVWTCGVRCGLG